MTLDDSNLNTTEILVHSFISLSVSLLIPLQELP
jgi:hypothetical protein